MKITKFRPRNYECCVGKLTESSSTCHQGSIFCTVASRKQMRMEWNNKVKPIFKDAYGTTRIKRTFLSTWCLNTEDGNVKVLLSESENFLWSSSLLNTNIQLGNLSIPSKWCRFRSGIIAPLVWTADNLIIFHIVNSWLYIPNCKFFCQNEWCRSQKRSISILKLKSCNFYQDYINSLNCCIILI